ncbi:MAG: UDP-2,3-diacylglucosamine diphosphatase [Trichlorobacter sp.]|jgi:UDP-2,3-diacylglucosamine hydrolase
MRTIFLADAHLHDPADRNYQLLLRFLEDLQGTVDVLCILGDLFDFRVGLPALSFAEQEPVVEALARLSRTGTRLIYLEGNHDFHLGAAFAKRIGAELYTRPVIIEIQARRLLLCHGDLANPADWRYRLLYLTLHNRGAALVGRMLPAAFVQGLRRRLQRTSRGRDTQNKPRLAAREIISAYGAAICQQGYDAVVLGHFHQPLLEQRHQFTLLALGDWIEQFSYGELLDGVFSLSTYQP